MASDASMQIKRLFVLVFCQVLFTAKHVMCMRDKDLCASLASCYCIKYTDCGWCKSSNKASVQQGSCKAPDWITDEEKCPQLFCASLPTQTVRKLAPNCILAVVVLTLWLAVWCWRKSLDRENLQSMQSVDRATRRVTFVDNHHARQVVAKKESSDGAELLKAPPESKEFFGFQRTFSGFKKGQDCPAGERLPQKTFRKYALNVQVLSLDESEKGFENMRVPRFRLLTTLRIAMQWRSALGAKLTLVLGLTFLSAAFMAFYSISAVLMDEQTYWSLALFIKEIISLTSAMQTAVSLLLSFYALNRINWYWSMMRQGWKVAGRAHDMGMLVGPALGDTEQDQRIRYTLYRHVVMCFFFAYQPFTPAFQFVGFQPLVDCGLAMKDEVDLLQKSHSAPRTVVEGWLSILIQKHVIDEATRHSSLLALREFRGAMAGVGDLVDERAPVSFESVLYIAVYALCFLLPFAPGNLDYENRRAVMAAGHIAIVLGDGVLIAFYVSLLHLLYHLQAPFDSIGAPQDCLNPIAIILTTEKKLRDYLCIKATPYILVGGSIGHS